MKAKRLNEEFPEEFTNERILEAVGRLLSIVNNFGDTEEITEALVSRIDDGDLTEGEVIQSLDQCFDILYELMR
jgi:hypothetical protein